MVFTSPTTVNADVQYAIVVSAPDAVGDDCAGSPPDAYLWDNAVLGSYTGGKTLLSADGAATWDAPGGGLIDGLFKTYVGLDMTTPTTTIALSPASPNGSNGWYTSSVGVTISATDPDDAFLKTRCALDPSTVRRASMLCRRVRARCRASGTDYAHTIYAAS